MFIAAVFLSKNFETISTPIMKKMVNYIRVKPRQGILYRPEEKACAYLDTDVWIWKVVQDVSLKETAGYKKGLGNDTISVERKNERGRKERRGEASVYVAWQTCHNITNNTW